MTLKEMRMKELNSQEREIKRLKKVKEKLIEKLTFSNNEL